MVPHDSRASDGWRWVRAGCRTGRVEFLESTCSASCLAWARRPTDEHAQRREDAGNAAIWVWLASAWSGYRIPWRHWKSMLGGEFVLQVHIVHDARVVFHALTPCPMAAI